MYTTYFGLKEKPFRLVPDPQFLFLSASHEEALAHLSYAVSQQEGFAEVTGEVGTGKTTLCRSFLDELGPEVETAFIFNSKLDARQLLKAILDEFAIDCATGDTADMTQALYLFLLEKRTQSKTVLLLIDEAQNLSRETLEQLRLLSNLETTRNKLLQIILVGQPELSELLNTHDMRQLRQRINLSCHIRSLGLGETRQYIRYRVNKASAHVRSLFSPQAENLIYRYAKGTPRLINILCDRSLVAAFSLGRKKVTPDLVKTAFTEVNAGLKQGRGLWAGFRAQKTAVFTLACIGCLAASLFFFTGRLENPPPVLPDSYQTPPGQIPPAAAQGRPQNPLKPPGPETDPGAVVDAVKETLPESLCDQGMSVKINQDRHEPAPQKEHTKSSGRDTDRAPMPGEPPAFVPVLSGAQEISSYLLRIIPRATRENVLGLVLSLWTEDTGVPASSDSGGSGKALSDARFFEIRAMQASQLKVLHLLGNESQIKRFNLPAILSFSVDGHTGFLAVTGVENQSLCRIAADDVQHGAKVDLGELAPFLSKDIFIIWKDIFGYARVISPSSLPAAIVSVKLAMEQLGFENIVPTAAYDAGLVNAVKTIQKRYGLVADGLVGPMTKIVIIQELEAVKHRRERTDGSSSSPGTMAVK